MCEQQHDRGGMCANLSFAVIDGTLLLYLTHKLASLVPDDVMILGWVISADRHGRAMAIMRLTQLFLIDGPAHDQLVAVLHKRFKSPIKRLSTALIRARSAQEYPSGTRPHIPVVLDTQGETEHGRSRILKGVKGHLWCVTGH